MYEKHSRGSYNYSNLNYDNVNFQDIIGDKYLISQLQSTVWHPDGCSFSLPDLLKQINYNIAWRELSYGFSCFLKNKKKNVYVKIDGTDTQNFMFIYNNNFEVCYIFPMIVFVNAKYDIEKGDINFCTMHGMFILAEIDPRYVKCIIICIWEFLINLELLNKVI